MRATGGQRPNTGGGNAQGNQPAGGKPKDQVPGQEEYKTGAMFKGRRVKTVGLEIDELKNDRPSEAWAPPKPIAKPPMHLRPPSFVPNLKTKSLFQDYKEGPPEAFF